MGLVGNLEDLGLGDILQIVSLARKSGVLNLSSGDVKGKIIFKDGLVVSALSSEIRRNFGLMLVEDGLLNQPQLEQVVAEAKKSGEPGLIIKDFISSRFSIPREKIDQVITKEVEDVVYSFFNWPEGNFSFDLMEVADEINSLKNPWRQFVLDQGLSPQYLSMEGTRLQDERKRAETGPAVGALPGEEGFEIKDEEFKRNAVAPPAPVEQDFSSISDFLAHHGQQAEEIKLSAPARAVQSSPPPAPKPAEAARPEVMAPAKAAPVSGKLVIAVDDESAMLEALDRNFSRRGFQVEIFSAVAAALARLKELHRKSITAVVIADLIMPATADKSLLGGLEVLRELKALDPKIPCILATDYENQPAQKQAENLGVNYFFFKPKSSQIDENFSNPEIANYLQLLESAVSALAKALPAGAEQVEQKTDELFDLVNELKREMGDEDFTIPEIEEKKSRGLAMLRNMIQELNDPSTSGQVTLMVLRFAAELMNRAVIFVVTKDQVAGLGQFGIQLDGKDPEKHVRRMRIPLDEPSVFQEVMQKRIPLKKKLKSNKWNQYLVDRLGGKEPREVFVAPIITSGKIAAIIYGDNIPEDREIGDTESLEIFLVQVGLAIEKALLERRLKEYKREESIRGEFS